MENSSKEKKVREKNRKVEENEKKYNLFIGSSSEALPIAIMIEEIIKEYDDTNQINPVKWNDFFDKHSSMSFLDTLMLASEESRFSIFIFAKDDKLFTRGEEKYTTRSNVLFESGIFIGKNTSQNVAFLVNRADEKYIDIISDLRGFNLHYLDADNITYDTLYQIGKNETFKFDKEKHKIIYSSVKKQIRSSIERLCEIFLDRELKNVEPLKNTSLILDGGDCFKKGIELVESSKYILLSSIVLSGSTEEGDDTQWEDLDRAYKERMLESPPYFSFARLFDKEDDEIQKLKNDFLQFIEEEDIGTDKTKIISIEDTTTLKEVEFIISDNKVLLVFPDYTKGYSKSVVGFGIYFENPSVIPMLKCWYKKFILDEPE